MNPKIVRMLLNIYIVFQSVIWVIGLVFLIMHFCDIIFLALFTMQYIPAFLICLVIITAYFLNLITAPISVVAIMKIKQNKTISKLQKFSIITFPITTLLVGLFVLWGVYEYFKYSIF